MKEPSTDARTITVCHVVGGLADHGGTWKFAHEVAAGGGKENVDHVLWMHQDFQPKDQSVKYVLEGRMTQVHLNLARDLVGGLKEVIPLLRWVWKRRDVVLHAHTRPGVVAAALVCCLVRRPLVIHIHGMPRRRWVYRTLCRAGGGTLVFNSHKTCRHFGCTPDQSYIVTPTITWPERPLGHIGESDRFVAAAMFYSWKNLHLIIDAFNRLRPRYAATQLEIFGDPDAEPVSEYVRLLRQRAASSPGVRLLKYDLAWLDLWHPSDVFVHAAENEPFGIVMLEAFARGCRMVVPPGTFLDELPAHQRTEGVYRAKRLDPQALAEAMEAARRCPATSDQLWHRRLELKHRFSVEHAAAQLRAIYRAVVAG